MPSFEDWLNLLQSDTQAQSVVEKAPWQLEAEELEKARTANWTASQQGSDAARAESNAILQNAFQVAAQDQGGGWMDTLHSFLSPISYSVKDIYNTLQNDAYSGWDKFARIGSNLFDPITNPGISEIGRRSGQTMRNAGLGAVADNAESLGAIIGGIVGGPWGVPAGIGVGSRISGRYDTNPAKGKLAAGIAAGTVGLKQGLSPYVGKPAATLASKVVGNVSKGLLPGIIAGSPAARTSGLSTLPFTTGETNNYSIMPDTGEAVPTQQLSSSSSVSDIKQQEADIQSSLAQRIAQARKKNKVQTYATNFLDILEG